MTRRPSLIRLIAAALLVLALPGVLSGCGKRGMLEAPEGEEERYSYPRQYPR